MTQLDFKKTPGFGIGQKQSAERIKALSRRAPAPNNYTIKSQFQTNKDHDKGHSFGIPYQAYEKTYNENLIHENKGWTDPGCYNIQTFVDKIKNNKKNFSFGTRMTSSPNNYPSPDRYHIEKIDGFSKDGRYVNQKFRNSQSRNFSKDSRKTFMDTTTQE